MEIIDTPWNTTRYLSCLSEQKVKTIIRYYNRNNSRRLCEKKLTLPEARAISNKGMNIAVVFQQRQNQIADFNYEKGRRAGKEAYDYAKKEIGQPEGSAIYFAVDFDARENQVKNEISRFFEGIRDAFKAIDGNPKYKVGAYGSGLVCTTLKAKGLSEFTWLSMSRGFHGTRKAIRDHKYDLLQYPPRKICKMSNRTICESYRKFLDVDCNKKNPNVDSFGAFMLHKSTRYKTLWVKYRF